MRIKVILNYLIGGYVDGSYSNKVAKMEQIYFDENVWTDMGTLLSTRFVHRSVVLGNTIIHVGGQPGAKWVIKHKMTFLKFCFRNFEQWTWNGVEFDKLELGGALTSYAYYPESFLVKTGYCS